MWDKLGNVNEGVLANYLKNEYPQTVAVVLSKVKPDHAARVLTLLPEGFAMEVVMRMLRMEPVQREILERIHTLRQELGFARSYGTGQSLVELLNQPSLNINGLQSANVGAQAANVIPTVASAVLDLRLVLGTRLQVTEETELEVPDDDPRAQPLLVYGWLGWLQESLLASMASR